MKLRYVIIISLMIIFSLVPHVRMAFSIGTGFGLPKIQEAINQIQSRAINKKINDEDKRFLSRLYPTLSVGAFFTFILPESSRLTWHYLYGEGSKTSINKKLFIESSRVIKRMDKLKSADKKICTVGFSQKSNEFDMGHIKPLDAHFALYFGTITLDRLNKDTIQWTVNLPWKFPTYESLYAKYGSYYKEQPHLPNALSFLGLEKPLVLPNGLGGELELQGLAKSFDTVTVWEEKYKC